MPESDWPTPGELHAALRPRLIQFIESCGGIVGDVGRGALSASRRPLAEPPQSLTSVLVPTTCIAAGGDWHRAIWPAVAAECMMAAADLFDDAADADPGGDSDQPSPGVLLTAAAGMLSLSFVAVARAVEDGSTPETAVALVRLLGERFADAANGQATNVAPGTRQIDALDAYRQAAAKSGPLGSLIARLGARTGTDDQAIVELLGEFGRRLAVRSQLLNDARDAAPDALGRKADVRAGARTVPLAFTGSSGAPRELTEQELIDWEGKERGRIAASGGLAAAYALAEAERLRAIDVLNTLEGLGHPVLGLRQIV